MRLAPLALLGMFGILEIGLAQSPAAGRLLIATRKSHDPDLAQSVILLIHTAPDGAIGLILNKPPANPPEKDLFFGGPIPLGVRMLIRSRTRPPNAEHVFADVYAAGIAALPPAKAGARFYAGYAGWSPAQLNDEISRGLWRVIPADAALVFDPRPGTLWQRLTR
jgi:putative transcriptional regulator